MSARMTLPVTLKKTLLFTIVGIFVLAVVALFAVPTLIDLSLYRVPLSVLLTQTLNREATIHGDMSIKSGVVPSIIVENVVIHNPRDGMSPYFIRADRLELTFSISGLLRGQFNIKNVALEKTAINLERYPDGANNWSFGSGGKSLFVTTLRKLSLSNVDVSYYAEGSVLQSVKMATAELVRDQDGRYNGRLTGEYVGRSIALEFETPEWPDFPQRPLLLTAQAEIGRNAMALDINLAPAGDSYVLSGDITVKRLYVDEMLSLFPEKKLEKPYSRQDSLPLDDIFARRLLANLSVTVKKAQWKKHVISQAQATLRFGDNKVELKNFSGRVDNYKLLASAELQRHRDEVVLLGTVITPWFDITLPTEHAMTGVVMQPDIAFATYGKSIDGLIANHAIYATLSPTVLEFESNIVNRIEIATAHLAHDQRQGLFVLAEGSYNGAPVAASFALSSIVSHYMDDAPLDMTMAGKIGETRFDVDTRLTPTIKDSRLFALGIAGKQLKELEPVLGINLVDLSDYQATAHLVVEKRSIDLAQLAINTPKSNLRGSLRYQWGNVDLPAWQVRVHNSHVDLTEVKKIADSVPKESIERAVISKLPRSTTSVIPDITLSDYTKAPVMIDAKIEHTRFIDDDIPMDDATMSLFMAPGKIEVSVAAERFFRGRLQAYLSLASANDTTASQVEVDIRDVDYGYLLKKFNISNKMTGKANVKINFAGLGVTLKELLKNAEGSILVTGGKGVIANRYLRLWGDDITRQLLTAEIMQEERSNLECVVGRFHFEKGVLKSDAMLIGTEQITIAGSGGADLVSEQLEFVLSPQPKKPSLLSLATPIRIRGTFAKPVASPHKLATLWTVGSLVAGVVNPAILLARFAKLGSVGENACLEAIGGTGKKSVDKKVIKQVKNIVNLIQNPFEKLPDIDIPENMMPKNILRKDFLKNTFTLQRPAFFDN